MPVLGIDIGGSGIKGAPVDTVNGKLLEERHRVATPKPATPEAVAAGVLEIQQAFNWAGLIGCGYPGVIKGGRTMTAANLDPAWIGIQAEALLAQCQECKVTLINDADAAAVAEMRFGAGRDQPGVVLMLTIGTGIGTALFVDGQLVPNTELGHLIIRGKDAEHRASDRVRVERDLTWKRWAKRFNEYLEYIEALLWPDLIIIGGGASKSFAKFIPFLTPRAHIVPAQLLNEAGIIGAAVMAAERG
jgi:polyphosphate glucokinase